MVQIAFQDAEAYAACAGAALPREAQWEYAARGGLRDQAFSWGNTWARGRANTWQGDFPPNGYGLFDMIGNVWEWTADWYLPGHDRLPQRSDPIFSIAAESFIHGIRVWPST